MCKVLRTSGGAILLQETFSIEKLKLSDIREQKLRFTLMEYLSFRPLVRNADSVPPADKQPHDEVRSRCGRDLLTCC